LVAIAKTRPHRPGLRRGRLAAFAYNWRRLFNLQPA